MLNSETAAVADQTIECHFFTIDEPALLSWACDLEFTQQGDMTSGGRRRKTVAASPKKVTKLLRGGHGVQLSSEESADELVDWVTIGNLRASGIRFMGVHMAARKRREWRERVTFCSQWFETAVAALSPVYAYLQLGGSSARCYDSRFGERRIAPVTGYYWRNYLTPAVSAGTLLGDGTRLVEPRFIDFGPMPFVSLEQRDDVLRLLEPLLPPRRNPAPHLQPEDALRLQLASADGGVEPPQSLSRIHPDQ